MKIAIIGAGVSGLITAYRLQPKHEITLFEANDYLGGHANTVEVDWQGERQVIDTGFIVFNDWTYPKFIELLDELQIPSHETSMSFSVRCDAANLEYNGSSLNGLFAQRRNLLRPSFYRMIRDILRFNRDAPELVLKSPAFDETPVGEFLSRLLRPVSASPNTPQRIIVASPGSGTGIIPACQGVMFPESPHGETA